MHRFSRMHLSPTETVHNIDGIDLDEKSKIAEWIALIAVIDQRKDYLAAGYSCTRNFCMARLHMSEDEALRRIQVARTALRFPELFECVADGRLGITTASVLAPHLEPETAGELLAAAAFRTQREIVQMLAERKRALAVAPAEPAGELLTEAASCEHAAPHVISHLNRCECVAADVSATAPAPVATQKIRRGRVTPGATGDYDVRLTITQAEHEDLRKAQALLGHAVPSGDPALVYARAMKHYLVHLEKERLGVKPGAREAAAVARRIPKALRRFIWERDGGRCAFVSADGHRCEETRRLEVDHITPVALGGTSRPENLRLLCSAHNQHEAGRVLGPDYVRCRRELSRRERARAKVAAQASRERQRARDAAATEVAAAPARARDAAATETAVAHARTREAEARRGAEIADAMPDDATTAECLKAALHELARPLLKRCERLARCTT
jgi:hypothetical protein